MCITNGDLRLIDAVFSSSTFNPNELVNDKGENPLYLAIKSHWKKDCSAIVLAVLLRIKLLDPSKRDQSGRRPHDYPSNEDSRIDMLEQPMYNFKPDLPPQQKKMIQRKSSSKCIVERLGHSINQGSSVVTVVVNGTCVSSSDPHEDKPALYNGKEVSTFQSMSEVSSVSASDKSVHKMDSPLPEYEPLSPGEKLEYLVKTITNCVPKPLQDNFKPNKSVPLSPRTPNYTTMKKQQSNNGAFAATYTGTISDTEMKCLREKDDSKQAKTQGLDEQPTSKDTTSTIFAGYGLDFDTLPWEVEVTASVLKFLKNEKGKFKR